MLILSAALAVVAAVLFAVSGVVQQRATHAASRLVLPGRSRAATRTAGRLLFSGPWLAGSAIALVGFGFHASALNLGSLSVVQPLLTLTLPVSIVLGGGRGRRVPLGDWSGVVLMCAGVAAFLAVTASPAGAPRPRAILLTAVLIAVCVTAGLYLLGSRLPPAGRAAAWGSAAAIAFGVTAALTKAATEDLTRSGAAHTLADWPLWGLIVAAVSGVILEQAAFASGPLTAVMVPVTMLNPISACVLGEIGWHQHLAGSAGLVAVAIAVGLLLALFGVLMLSRSSLLAPPPVRVR